MNIRSEAFMDSRRVFRTRLVAMCVVAIAAFLPSSVSAAPIFYSQLMTSALAACPGGPPPCSDNDNTGQQFSVDTLGPQTSSAQGLATATGFASVVDGVLHASASGMGGPGFFNGWNASGIATFGDTLTFVSNTLPVGTFVQLAWAIDVDYTLSGACNPVLPRAAVRAQLHTFRFVDDTCDAFDVNNASGVTTVKLGDELQFQTSLVADATGPGQLVGFADAANTFRFTIDPIGDFSYITASGNSYLTPAAVPVPEPASLILVGAGVITTVGRARYRRRRSRSFSFNRLV
jgi:hypothetical protein